jgi:hypothetical protein
LELAEWESCLFSSATPPGMRVYTGRFEKLRSTVQVVTSYFFEDHSGKVQEAPQAALQALRAGYVLTDRGERSADEATLPGRLLLHKRLLTDCRHSARNSSPTSPLREQRSIAFNCGYDFQHKSVANSVVGPGSSGGWYTAFPRPTLVSQRLKCLRGKLLANLKTTRESPVLFETMKRRGFALDGSLFLK